MSLRLLSSLSSAPVSSNVSYFDLTSVHLLVLLLFRSLEFLLFCLHELERFFFLFLFGSFLVEFLDFGKVLFDSLA